jgi:hypothetical protein
MPSSSTITINQVNYGIDLDQHLDHDSGSTQLVNTHSDTSELVNTNSTLPTHHLPSHHTYPANGSNSNNNHHHTPATVVRVGTFPPRSNNQTLYAYIVTNFTVITIVIVVITLVATVAGIIVAIVLAVIYK